MKNSRKFERRNSFFNDVNGSPRNYDLALNINTKPKINLTNYVIVEIFCQKMDLDLISQNNFIFLIIFTKIINDLQSNNKELNF